MLPLFSAPSSRSWGLGELPDLVPLSAWLASAGFDRLMILPIGVVAPGDTSPYSSLSSMAIDPTYIAMEDVIDFSRAGGVEALSPEGRRAREAARGSERVDYDAVRRAKGEALALAFTQFYNDEWSLLTLRASELARYVSRERWWLDEWALYAALADTIGTPDWRLWPPPLRERQPAAIDEARRRLARSILRRQYVQWIAESQWQAARAAARERGVTIFGDMPFMVSAASPEVWARPDEVMFDVSLGVPPDAFSETGQDWGLPTYRWDRIRETGYSWLRARARRMAALYDGVRVDHLVGLFRTYGRPPEGPAFFSPAAQGDQIAQGETMLRLLRDCGATIIAEDLGVVPDFVRESLARLDVPGLKILRWEREWWTPGQPFIHPALFPAQSAAMTATHDTETLAEWWGSADAEERTAALALHPDHPGGFTVGQAWTAELRDAFLALAYRSGSTELFLPVQDVFGWTDRINVPATVGDYNWTWRLPWLVDHLDHVPEAQDRAEACRRLAAART
jgi:4-alpha-glucanotransferase